MTLDEAIEINKGKAVAECSVSNRQAIQLGIEALEKILLLRRMELNGQRVEPYTRLPSETREGK